MDVAPGFAGDRRPPDLAVEADARAFLDLRMAVADVPAGIVGIHYQTVTGCLDFTGRDLSLKLPLLAHRI